MPDREREVRTTVCQLRSKADHIAAHARDEMHTLYAAGEEGSEKAGELLRMIRYMANAPEGLHVVICADWAKVIGQLAYQSYCEAFASALEMTLESPTDEPPEWFDGMLEGGSEDL